MPRSRAPKPTSRPITATGIRRSPAPVPSSPTCAARSTTRSRASWPALPPIRPNRPGMAVLLAIAAGAGLVLGIGLVLLLEQIRNGFRTPRDVERLLSLPSLGILPRVADGATTKSAGGQVPGQ